MDDAAENCGYGLYAVPITDPTFAAALETGLVNTTVTVLVETFAISAGVMGVALLVAFWLKREKKNL